MFSTLFFLMALSVVSAQPYTRLVPESILQAPTDSMATLSKTWVLQQKLEQHDNGLEQVLPLEELRLTLLPDGSYQILRHKAVPGAPAGLQTVEEGRWELNASRGLIGMQTKYVDGRSILTTMMYRWEIEELSEERLVLKQFIMGPAYLVLHAEADAKK